MVRPSPLLEIAVIIPAIGADDKPDRAPTTQPRVAGRASATLPAMHVRGTACCQEISMNAVRSAPVVMVFAGLDPTGGAGIQADIEAIASQGCHASPIITAIAIQDTRDVQRVLATPADIIIEQARAVLDDVAVSAFKIGLLGSVEAAQAVHVLLRERPQIPVILDPVLRAGGGAPVATAQLIDAMNTLLLPLTTVLTPNAAEARTLAPEADTLDACAMALLDRGCEFVLITGADEPTPDVVNSLYGNHRRLEQFHWQRLPEQFHGSGCTLASSIAGLLAHGREPFTAIHEAQDYTWEALSRGYRIGKGQAIPNRLFWAHAGE